MYSLNAVRQCQTLNAPDERRATAKPLCRVVRNLFNRLRSGCPQDNNRFVFLSTHRAHSSSSMGSGESRNGPAAASSSVASRSSIASSSVASTAEANQFKLLHCQAAIQTVEHLMGIWPTRLHSQLGEIKKRLIHFEKSTRRQKNDSFSINPKTVQSKMGGRFKKSSLLDIQRKFKHEEMMIFKQGMENTDMPSSTNCLHIRTALATYISGQLHRIGGMDLKAKAIERLITKQYIGLLNRQDWSTLIRTTELEAPAHGGTTHTSFFESRLVPAREMDLALAQRYRQDGVSGICSLDTTEHRHAVNLWRTEFEPTPDEKIKIPFRFSALRHGIHDAFDTKNDPTTGLTRAWANDARVNEFVHAALLSHIEKHNVNPNEIPQNQTVTIDIASVNLVTPMGKENTMIKQQTEAFARAEKNGVMVRLEKADGSVQTLHVRPRFLTFNTPVNKFSFGRTGKLSGIAHHADSFNQKGLARLIGSTKNGAPIGGLAGERILQLKATLNSTNNIQQWHTVRQRLHTLTNLVEQTRSILSTKSHHAVGHEPYKLPVRLLAIANECACIPAFNCKSGKDRTGQLNVEIKDFYAALNFHNGELRDVDAKRQGVAKSNYQRLFFEGGDREIQALNTGVAGSKAQLNYYNTMMDAQKGTINNIKGLSRWVGS